MIVFHPVHVVPAEELGRICSNRQTVLIFFFYNLFRNLTCNCRYHHSLSKIEVYLTEVLAVRQLTLWIILCIRLEQLGLIDRPLVYKITKYKIFLICLWPCHYSNWNSIPGENKFFGVNLLVSCSLYEEKHKKPLTTPQTLQYCEHWTFHIPVSCRLTTYVLTNLLYYVHNSVTCRF